MPLPRRFQPSPTSPRQSGGIATPSKPPSSRTGYEIPDSHAKTEDGRQFLAFDSGKDDEKRILIFATQESLSLLDKSTTLLGDGTFNMAPGIFYQIFTLHIMHKGHYISVLSSLLPDKTQETYSRLFTEIKRLCPNLSPTSFSSDFELAINNSVKEAFNGVRLYLCNFHFRQSVWRHIQSLGWQQRYVADMDFAVKCRKVPALAYLPETDVVEGFEELQEDDDLVPLLDSLHWTKEGTER